MSTVGTISSSRLQDVDAHRASAYLSSQTLSQCTSNSALYM